VTHVIRAHAGVETPFVESWVARIEAGVVTWSSDLAPELELDLEESSEEPSSHDEGNAETVDVFEPRLDSLVPEIADFAVEDADFLESDDSGFAVHAWSHAGEMVDFFCF